MLIPIACAGLAGLLVALVRFVPGSSSNPPALHPSAADGRPYPERAIAETAPPSRNVAVAADSQPLELDSLDVAAPPVEDLADIAAETDADRVNWRVLRYSLQEFRKLEQVEPGSRTGALVCRAVVTVLRLSGRGSVPDPTFSPRAGEHYVISKGEGFLWYEGEFPEYDAWKHHTFAMARYESALMKDPSSAGEKPVFDPINFSLIEARAVEAIESLERQYGFR